MRMMQSFVTLLTPQAKSPDISDIPADSGVVVQKSPNKGYKEAIYKDPKGKIDTFSALCPHLGCQLQVGIVGRTLYCSVSLFMHFTSELLLDRKAAQGSFLERIA